MHNVLILSLIPLAAVAVFIAVRLVLDACEASNQEPM